MNVKLPDKITAFVRSNEILRMNFVETSIQPTNATEFEIMIIS